MTLYNLKNVLIFVNRQLTRLNETTISNWKSVLRNEKNGVQRIQIKAQNIMFLWQNKFFNFVLFSKLCTLEAYNKPLVMDLTYKYYAVLLPTLCEPATSQLFLSLAYNRIYMKYTIRLAGGGRQFSFHWDTLFGAKWNITGANLRL